MQVKFGTDGWRAIIAKDYTFDNLKLATLASARYFLGHPNRAKGVCIGYDTRFMSKEFAEYTADVFSSQGLKVFLSEGFASTPAVSLYTKAKELAGGIVITASHNPPIYNGFLVAGSSDTFLMLERPVTKIEKRRTSGPAFQIAKPLLAFSSPVMMSPMTAD